MSRIRLYVCCHKETYVPEETLLVPIQVGAALSAKRFPGFLTDDTGCNISAQNRSYCELTAQYWAWKNDSADYVGFFHYRRYLYPQPNVKRAYRLEQLPSPKLLTQLGYDDFETLITDYDLIAPIGEDMHLSVREHYAAAAFHHPKDLSLAERLVQEKYPCFCSAADQYLAGSVCYFGNMYIMRRPVFEDYCAWLFPILKEFDRLANTSEYSIQEQRVDGYLAERLFGIYYTYQKQQGNLRMLELPRVHFELDRNLLQKKKLLAAILPPGTRRRAWIKRLFG